MNLCLGGRRFVPQNDSPPSLQRGSASQSMAPGNAAPRRAVAQINKHRSRPRKEGSPLARKAPAGLVRDSAFGRSNSAGADAVSDPEKWAAGPLLEHLPIKLSVEGARPSPSSADMASPASTVVAPAFHGPGYVRCTLETTEKAEVLRKPSQDTLYEEPRAVTAFQTGLALQAASQNTRPGAERTDLPGTTAAPQNTIVVTKYSAELLSDCFSAMHFCWYGLCEHDECRSGLDSLAVDSPAAMQHLARAQAESATLGRYVERIITLTDLKPAVLERGVAYMRRLRRKIDVGTLLHAESPTLYSASRNWGTHYLVFVVATMLARKFMEDEAGPRLAAYAKAGGFPTHALRKSEREMLAMLDYCLF